MNSQLWVRFCQRRDFPNIVIILDFSMSGKASPFISLLKIGPNVVVGGVGEDTVLLK